MLQNSETVISPTVLPATEKDETGDPARRWSVQETTENGQDGTIYRAVTAWSLTAALNLLLTQFEIGDGRKGCWKTFPVCNPEALKTQTHLPLFLRQMYSCECLLLLLAAATFVHWSCVFGLFRRRRWRDQYLSQVFFVTLVALFFVGLIIRDPATVFLRVLPTILDACTSACVLLDYFNKKE